MKLSNVESLALYNGLLDAFPAPGPLNIIMGQPPIEMPLARIASTGSTRDDYFKVVTVANAEGWIGRLLDGLRAALPSTSPLIPIIDGFAGLRAPSDVPAHLALLLDGAPFVNQQSLRGVLHEMTQTDGPKVLQITGAPISGKTYSQFLIDHVARSVNARRNVSLPFEATTTAREVIEDLARQMRLGTLPTYADAPQDTTAVTRMVRDFAIAATDLKEDWWLIFDGFDTQRIDDSVVTLMHGLGQAIGMGQLAHVRLFLLAWNPNRSISGPPPGRVTDHAVRLFERDEVKDYLDDLVSQFAMPDGMQSTDQILDLCYEGWDAVPDPLTRASYLTRRIHTIVKAARDAKAGR